MILGFSCLFIMYNVKSFEYVFFIQTFLTFKIRMDVLTDAEIRKINSKSIANQ